MQSFDAIDSELNFDNDVERHRCGEAEIRSIVDVTGFADIQSRGAAETHCRRTERFAITCRLQTCPAASEMSTYDCSRSRRRSFCNAIVDHLLTQSHVVIWLSLLQCSLTSKLCLLLMRQCTKNINYIKNCHIYID